VDRRLRDLKGFIKRTSKPLGEILKGRREVKLCLMGMGYKRKTAEIYSFLFPNTYNLRVSVEGWVRDRKSANWLKRSKRIKEIWKKPTKKQIRRYKLFHDGMSYSEIAKLEGVSREAIKQCMKKWRKREFTAAY
jgi:hypothetical protein